MVSSMIDRPEWLTLGESLVGPLLSDARMALDRAQWDDSSDFHVGQLPMLALYHLAHCMDSIGDTNAQGRHAVSLCLLRQTVEAVTIIELGLCCPSFGCPQLRTWDCGEKTHGDIGKALQTHIWPRYGFGLWGELWSDLFTSLAKAVQPYAHCSPELLQWNLAVLAADSNGMIVSAGSYDAIKASRITTLEILVTWTLGRLTSANATGLTRIVGDGDIQHLGSALAGSEFLVKGSDWSIQFWPHMLFPDPSG